jgi:polyhydroxybutyrate depolymerase
MGGGMSHYIACHAADVFAAVAPAAFDLLKENVDACQPARPITVVSFRGSTDPVVPYAGGYSALVQGMPVNFLGAKATFDKWSALNHCSGSASAEDSNGCAAYSGCQGGVDVVLCTKQGGGHEPGNAKVAWPILKKHVLP